MAARELIESRQYTEELQGQRRATMEFYVDAPSDTAHLDPGVPKKGLGGQYPGDPSLVCDSVVASYWPGSNNHSRVTASFSNDRAFRGAPQIDKLNIGYKEFAADFVQGVTKLPVQIHTPGGMTISRKVGDADPVPVEVTTWDLQARDIEEWYTVVQIQVVLNTLTMDDVYRIGIQNNRIHYIAGGFWQFRAGSIRRRDEIRYETTYTWRFDPGIPSIAGTYPIFPPTGLVSALGIESDALDKKWTRPPYEEVHTRVSTVIDFDAGNGPEQDAHDFHGFFPWTRHDNGFKTLPGNPL